MSDPPHSAASDAANTPHARTPSNTSILSNASSRSSGPSTAQGNLHAPQTPSRLRHSHAPGSSPTPESDLHQYHTFSSSPPQGDSPTQVSSLRSSSPPVDFEADGIHPQIPNGTGTAESLEQTRVHGQIVEEHSHGPDASTTLLENYSRKRANCGHSPCSHGTFSPTAASFVGQDSGSYGGRYRDEEEHDGQRGDAAHRVLGDAITDGLLGGRVSRPKMSHLESFMSWRGGANNGGGISTTRWLAEAHGIKGKTRMYLSYYIPFFNWISQYRLAFLKGDLIAAITMASFYIPMSLSYASNLGHLPPINGLYSFVFNPLIYAILGTCPQMVVGPEAAGSLLLGNVVRSSVDKGAGYDDDTVLQARIAGVVTGMAGAIIFVAGMARLGFLDSVLSRPFLRGFISAIGFVIFIDQLVPEMGLVEIQKKLQLDHSSSIEKIIFLFRNAGQSHALTCWVSFGAFAIIMVCRTTKRRLEPRFPSVAYIPDRFIVVVLSAVFTYLFSWDKHGLEVLGDARSSTGHPFPFHWPFIPQHMIHIREAMSTSFLIALLGFFESSVAAKSLSTGEAAIPKPHNSNDPGYIQGMSLSANRELVALGVANLVGGCFMSLPAFGGYGRSKVNASTGGRTPMSSIFLSLITLISVLYLVPYFYYLPKGVLSAMVSVVAYSLIEECPHDIRFFVRARGYSELGLMFLIFAATILYSLPLGIALGMGLSLLRVIRHATQPRIQILGRVPGTSDQFENAEENPSNHTNKPHNPGVEMVPHALIVKIPEPLTFANTGDLSSRLRRLEMYGTTAAHPALPRVRSEEHMRNVVFDVHGVTSLDASGAQVLSEIVAGYVRRGSRVFFCRVPGGLEGAVGELMGRSGIVEMCEGESGDGSGMGRGGFVRGVEEALRLAETETEEERGRRRSVGV